ncbi:two-component sensor histidine kinase, partial [Rubrivivax gelatinosus]|nr:two-component sensor histidine kinase [Rubrivivax gelatinosus]
HYLSQLQAGDAVAAAAGRLLRSGVSLRALIDDLSTFGRTSLGLGLDLARAELDLGAAVLDEVDQLRGAHPNRRIELEISGDTHGHWDGPRLQQLLRNLVSNALRYGASDTPVRVELRGEHDPVLLQVTNTGATLDAAAFGALFGPLQRGPALPDSEDSRDSLGLGLYIVREVAQAHGGDVAVQADGGLTTFSVHLPRRAPDARGS